MSGIGPRTIGNFKIERELGKGGMGVVLLGRHTSLERLAVLIANGLCDPNHGGGIEGGSIREELPEMVMVGGRQLVFDDDVSACPEILREEIKRKVTDVGFHTGHFQL